MILLGERDYRVTMDDFGLWNEALAERRNVSLRSYPGLNHLLIAEEGKSGPAEYLIPGHVSERVIQDIADWVKALRPL